MKKERKNLEKNNLHKQKKRLPRMGKQIHFNSLKLQRVDLRWHLTTTSATKINGWEKIQTVTNIKGVN